MERAPDDEYEELGGVDGGQGGRRVAGTVIGEYGSRLGYGRYGNWEGR